MFAIAAAMVYITASIIKWGVTSESSRIDNPFLIFLLATMVSMFASAVFYFLKPSTGLLLTLVVVNMFVMTAGLLPILLIFSLKLSTPSVQEAETPSSLSSSSDSSESNETATLKVQATGDSVSKTVIIVLILLDEFFMGWAFLLAVGPNQSLISIAANPLILFSSVVSSYWFIFTMSAEMLLTVFFFRNIFPAAFWIVLVLQSVIMLFAPTVLQNQSWISISVYAGSSLMIAMFIFMFEYFARNNAVNKSIADYGLRLLAVYALMMAGLFLWELNGDEVLFAASIVLEMILYFSLVLNMRKIGSAGKKSWLLDSKWAFGILSLTLVTEFFMGGLLDLQVYGASNFVGSIPFATISGNVLLQSGSSLYDFVIGFGAVTASPWFLIMMGVEMGALVAFKIKTTRELETKIRLGLVIVAYAVYTILLPFFVIPSQQLPKIPFLGWSMGIGTAGPVAPVFLLGLAGTYVVSGALSFLFGSRQFCSVFCTAAVMYQGTFYDSMKVFNRTSSVARKNFLTSRISKIYKITLSLVWASLIGTSIVSYMDSIRLVNLSVFGTDPTYFLYSFYFNFLWYIIFISIPFVGTYGCVSMGWCHWGVFNQFISRLGFFKLKVKDSNTCLHCKTKDCAKACPVGLTDLPSQFIKNGEFKSHKCIGVGDCVSACPYENEYFYDVRHWIKHRSGKRGERVLKLRGANA